MWEIRILLIHYKMNSFKRNSLHAKLLHVDKTQQQLPQEHGLGVWCNCLCISKMRSQRNDIILWWLRKQHSRWPFTSWSPDGKSNNHRVALVKKLDKLTLWRKVNNPWWPKIFRIPSIVPWISNKKDKQRKDKMPLC
jgi:hypothetical protein